MREASTSASAWTALGTAAGDEALHLLNPTAHGQEQIVLRERATLLGEQGAALKTIDQIEPKVLVRLAQLKLLTWPVLEGLTWPLPCPLEELKELNVFALVTSKHLTVLRIELGFHDGCLSS